jgi:hypothetical protein
MNCATSAGNLDESNAPTVRAAGTEIHNWRAEAGRTTRRETDGSKTGESGEALLEARKSKPE